VKIRTPLYDRAVAAFMCGFLLACVGGIVSWPWLTIASVLVAGLSYAMIWFAAKRVRPARVELGALQTFGDLSRLIAAHLQPRLETESDEATLRAN
jgi:hypothetical protein